MAYIIRHFDHDGITANGTFSNSWTPADNYTVKYFLVKRKDGTALTRTTITVRIANVPMTRDVALCSTFGTNIQTALPVDWDLPKDVTLDYSGTNLEGATVDLAVELVLEAR